MHNHGMQSQWLLLAIALTILSASAVAEQSRAAPGGQTLVVETDNRPLSDPADLALYGPIHLGDRQVPWGEIVALGPDSAILLDDGRCRFEYRYQVMNQGEGAAGTHVNRLTRSDDSVAAENSIEVLPSGQVRTQSGHITLWTGEHVIYVQLDVEEQVAETDTSNNLRRIRADVADGCADPRPQARPPGGSTRRIDPPPGRHNPPEPRSGTRAAPPEPTGSRAPVPQGKPAPGTSKPVPEDAPDCRPMLSATRTTALTQAGARATAVTAWEAAALAMYGSGFRWGAAKDQSTECSFQIGWRCTAKARPCRP